jgi:hypothetical protein
MGPLIFDNGRPLLPVWAAWSQVWIRANKIGLLCTQPAKDCPVTYPIHRQFIAAVAAAAVAITAFGAAPARAGNDNLGKALAALAGLAVLGVMIKNARDDKPTAQHQKIYRYGDTGRDDRIGRGGDDRVHPRPLPPRVGYKLLPQQCLRSVDSRDGRMRVFGQHCLERNYRHVNSLPNSCATRFRTERGTRHGYGARCLSRHGYQLARQ